MRSTTREEIKDAAASVALVVGVAFFAVGCAAAAAYLQERDAPPPAVCQTSEAT